MKHTKVIITVFASVVMLFFLSCSTMTGSSKSRSWIIPEKEKIVGTVSIASVEADMTGIRSFIENETASLIPLFLSEQKYLVIEDDEDADFIVEVKLREREYMRGWKTCKSASVEVYFRPGGKTCDYEAGIVVPLASGQAAIENRGTITSSKILHNLLKIAVNKAVRSLRKLK